MDLAILIAIACQRFMQDIAHTLACHFWTSLNKTITLNFFFFKPQLGSYPNISSTVRLGLKSYYKHIHFSVSHRQLYFAFVRHL